jgi:hypothetical protein
MARTGSYEQQYQTRGNQMPAGRGAVQLFSNNGLQEVAAGVGRVVENKLSQLDDDARAWAVSAMSKTQLDGMDMFETAKNQAGEGAGKFTENFGKTWETYKQETLKNAPNERARQYMQSQLSTLTTSLLGNAKEFENGERKRWRLGQAEKGVDDDAKRFGRMTPDQINDDIEKTMGKWSAYYATLDMTPEERAAALDATRGKLVKAAAISVNEFDGGESLLAQNAMARSETARAGDKSLPRGIRNNNPGNLRGNAEWKGKTGADEGGYLTFESPQSGLRAMAVNLLVQQNKHGLNTVQDIVTKYAPPSENDTASYIKQVSQALGVQPTQRVNLSDPATLNALMAVMIKQENGMQPFSPEQLRAAADSAINKTPMPESKGSLQTGSRVETGSKWFDLATFEEQQQFINMAETTKRQREAERRQRAAEVNALMTTAKDRMSDGLSLPVDEMTMIEQQVQAAGDPVVARRWDDLKAVQTVTQRLVAMTPQQVQDIINSEFTPAAQRDGATEREKLLLDTAEAILPKMMEGIKNDPLSWAVRAGAQIEPLDSSKPESFTRRVAVAQGIAEKYKIPVGDALLSKSEQTQLGAQLETMSLDAKLALGKQMQAGFREYFPDVVGSLANKDPVFAHATFLQSIRPDAPELAREILRGQEIIKERPDAKPDKADKEADIADVLGDSLVDMPQAVPGVVAAADALYARRAAGSTSYDSSIYKQALADVVGESDKGGGVLKHNGRSFILPSNVTSDEFELGLRGMGAKELEAITIGGGSASYGKKGKAWTGAHVYSSGQLRMIGYNTYQVYDDSGRPVPNPKGPNGQFIIKLDKAAITKAASEEATRVMQERIARMGGI